MLKNVKDSEEFVKNTGISRLTTYFKIGLYKFFKIYTALKNSILSSHYFRSNFKIIKIVCKSNEGLFTHRRRTVQMVLLITIAFDLFSLLCCETFYFFCKTFHFSVRLFIFLRETFSRLR